MIIIGCGPTEILEETSATFLYGLQVLRPQILHSAAQDARCYQIPLPCVHMLWLHTAHACMDNGMHMQDRLHLIALAPMLAL